MATSSKLAVILHADVVGSTALVQIDERVAHERIRDAFEAVSETIRRHGGTTHELRGDALLAEFQRASDAATAALAIQAHNTERNKELTDEIRPLIRVGIALGEVVIADNTVTGPGVVLAQRLEQLAEPGGVVIQGAVAETIPPRFKLVYQSLGEQVLKGFNTPVRALAVSPPGVELRPAVESDHKSPVEELEQGNRTGVKPTLRFSGIRALGSSEESQTLADALTEELRVGLASLTGVSLVTIDNAAYEASGTVQVAGARYRAVVQLQDQRAREQFWSGRYDGTSEDVFETLDSLAFKVSSALRWEVYERESKRTQERPPEKQTDEELLGLAGHILLGSKRADWVRSRAIVEGLVEKSPDNFMAQGILAASTLIEVYCGFAPIAPADVELGVRAARRAVELNEHSDFAHFILGDVLLHAEQSPSAAIREAERCLELNATYPLGIGLLGQAKIFSGDGVEGVPLLETALSANERFPANSWFMEQLALGCYVLGDFESAVEWARRADHQSHDVPRCLMVEIAASGCMGANDNAKSASDRLLGICPGFRVSHIRRWPFTDGEIWDRLIEDLNGAGLPA